MVIQNNIQPIQAYYHMSTTNQSFIDMHLYLNSIGIKNNRFFLVLYDPDLAGVDPRDPRLNQTMKLKILRECQINFWYFIREVVRIPDQGGTVGGGKRYGLHRGNLALNFGFLRNWNMFLELPRQHGKTISAICFYLWAYNFKATNSEIMFMNKKHDDSKMNLRRMREIRDALPSYLRLADTYNEQGIKLKPRNNVETMTNGINNNKITTKPGARSKSNASSLGRGCTMPIHWYDEFAFILYNKDIYLSATPAYKTASMNAKRNGSPYGILVTTTPGDTTTEEGLYAMGFKEDATPFTEEMYDWTEQKIEEVKNKNTNSTFIYMRFTYVQLGSGEEYFKEMVKVMNKDWTAIRREVMLEWSKCSDNCPFTQQDLDVVQGFVMKQPIIQHTIANYYTMNIYKQFSSVASTRKYPPIIGVDVSGGYGKDSSAITVIDSKTTEVIADFNCNYIPINDLAKVIHELVLKWMPTAIVNVERNGGFGASVLSTLIKSKIKNRLYYEIKDRVFEERFNGVQVIKQTKRVKVYGFDETKASRELLMEILRDRMEHHKDKFVSPILYNELTTLEIKKNGKIEHASNAHDDQVFSYLLALYVWYEGKDVLERFGLEKSAIPTDDDNELAEFGITEEYTDISEVISTDNNEIQKQLEFIKDNSKLYEQWLESEKLKDEAAEQRLLSTKLGRMAYANKFHTDEEELGGGTVMTQLPDYLFDPDNDNPEGDHRDDFAKTKKIKIKF